MLESILEKAGWKDVLIVLASAIAIIMIWRGVWNLLDHYFLTESFLGSQIVSIIAGTWILVILSSYRKKKGA